MGAAGSGKSTVGPLVASALHLPFIDGDDYHDPSAVERMHLGQPLGDADREPWLNRLHDLLVEHRHGGLVLACSALKRDYRQRLRGDLPNLTFVALRVDPDTLTERLSQRANHFAGPDLLASQLADLDLDGVAAVNGGRRPREVADAILATIDGRSAR